MLKHGFNSEASRQLLSRVCSTSGARPMIIEEGRSSSSTIKLEPSFAGNDFTGWRRNDAHHCAGGDGFSAAGFTHDSYNIAGVKLKVHTPQGVNKAGISPELDVQVFYSQKSCQKKSVLPWLSLHEPN